MDGITRLRGIEIGEGWGSSVLNIGHRGSSGLAPEHTFAAYDRAIQEGADFIELDLQMTVDGALVVMHDTTMDRTARGAAGDSIGPVRDKTLEQVKRCDAGSWFNSRYPMRARHAYGSLAIPSLSEVLMRYDASVNLYIEPKAPWLYPGVEAELLRVLDAHHRGHRSTGSRVVVQSFSAQSLQTVRTLDPRMPLVQLYPCMGSRLIRGTLHEAAGYASGIGLCHFDVDAALLDSAHELGLQVHPYTVNTRREMGRLIALGVDGIFTDFPGRLRRCLDGSVKVPRVGVGVPVEPQVAGA